MMLLPRLRLHLLPLALLATLAAAQDPQDVPPTMEVHVLSPPTTCEPLRVFFTGGRMFNRLSVLPASNSTDPNHSKLVDLGVPFYAASMLWEVTLPAETSIMFQVEDRNGLIGNSTDILVLPGPSTSCVGSVKRGHCPKGSDHTCQHEQKWDDYTQHDLAKWKLALIIIFSAGPFVIFILFVMWEALVGWCSDLFSFLFKFPKWLFVSIPKALFITPFRTVNRRRAACRERRERERQQELDLAPAPSPSHSKFSPFRTRRRQRQQGGDSASHIVPGAAGRSATPSSPPPSFVGSPLPDYDGNRLPGYNVDTDGEDSDSEGDGALQAALWADASGEPMAMGIAAPPAAMRNSVEAVRSPVRRGFDMV